MEDLEMPEMNTPQRGSKDGYLQLFFLSRQQLGRIIENMQAVTDPRIVVYTRFMISSITDDTLRADAEDLFEEELVKIEKLEISNDKKGEMRLQLCMQIQGDIVAFYDQFLGISHRLRVGLV